MAETRETLPTCPECGTAEVHEEYDNMLRSAGFACINGHFFTAPSQPTPTGDGSGRGMEDLDALVTAFGNVNLSLGATSDAALAARNRLRDDANALGSQLRGAIRRLAVAAEVPTPPASRGTAVPTTDRLAEIAARVARAHVGPWTWGWRRDDKDAPGSIVSGAESGRAYAVAMCPRYGKKDFAKDAEFIAHAREDVPWLVEQVRTLSAAAERGERDRELLEALEANPRMVGYATGCLGAKDGWTYTTPQYEVLPAEDLRDAIRKGLAARPPHQGRDA